MSNYFEVHAVSSPGDLLNEVGIREKVKTHAVVMHRGITPFKDIISIYRLYKLFKKLNPTIVHAHTPKAGLVSMLAATLCGVPLRLYSIAGIPFETSSGIIKYFLILIEKIIYNFSHKVYANSFGHEVLIKKMNLISHDKIKVLGQGSTNGINLEYFKTSPELVRRASAIRKAHNFENEFVFIYVSRLVPHKGAEVMLKAWREFSSIYQDVKLLICGRHQPNTHPLSKESSHILDSDESIVFTGYQLDIRPYYLAADVNILPSLREGLPNVLLQAGAMGLPSVCSDILGNTDVIKDGVNGILTKSNSIDHTLAGMKKIYLNAQLRLRLKSVARSSIKSKYERKQLLNEYLKEYINLLDQKGITHDLRI